MTVSTFFDQIAHGEVPWGDRTVPVPAFYREVRSFGAAFLTPLSKMIATLPSSRLKPVRVTPRCGITTISVLEYKDCDVGPYNELSVTLAVTLDREAPLLGRLLPLRYPETMSYVLQLPVTTEIAMAAGIEFYGFPKFLAQIEVAEQDGWMHCTLAEEGDHILSLSVRKPSLQVSHQNRTQLLSARGGRVLRSEMIASACQAGSTRDRANVKLELGDHPRADAIAALGLRRPVVGFFSPRYQAILTPVIEGIDA